MKTKTATPEEQAAMREVYPDGLPPGSMNESVGLACLPLDALVPMADGDECAVLCCEKTEADHAE